MTKYPNLVTRFIGYAKKETRSDEKSTTIPSTQTQVLFAKELVAELQKIGLQDVRIAAESGYVFATLPSNLAAQTTVKKLGFIAHMDTADFNAKNVQPQVIPNYDGRSAIRLGDQGKYELSPKDFPNLKNYSGHDLITAAGDTLLGADDKAGIAEIITAVEYLQQHPAIKHGEIRIGIGPDEEIGTGADHFDVSEFGAQLAYTVDGGPLGELEYETFNAAQAKLKISGKNVHPATAKGVMVNALQVAFDFHEKLPAAEVPEKTDGRQGYFHLLQLDGTVDEALMTYIIRDHDRAKFEARKQLMREIVAEMNNFYGQRRLQLDLKDQYYNMREVIEKDMTVVELAQQAMKNLGIKPIIYPVRGGTDGSKISFMGLPTPNIFAGGENMHSRFEFVSAQVMEKATDVILEIIKLATVQKD
ncbi:peptidase T [Liquorilactobacillus satsumensis]|nr:peptidase T [Liquorilactobacillus satsumensis]MCC7665940.1 peptidase T [Liquorilactobacillus satsumensis]MCP9312100.1 peptidase T [Liquorilactobacillus satsumensis]MCP9327813.1 peptidase T [Liquorilactobacillus satsumensis]MCP9356646.1 peptidase T [Liquorilactobacillus satsumensis]MCP9359378.1 peptidase T [Liquorilactobacillus satsumensis]